MSPELKFHSTIVSSTTLVVFSLWTQLTSHISEHPILSVIAASIISLGIYRMLTFVMLSIFRKIPAIKRWILGAYYMEGTWVGFFIAHDNTPRFYVETFEQDINYLIIRGKAFKENNTYHGTWIAENTDIDAKLGKLTYIYNSDVIGNSHINPGMAVFTFDRNSKDSPPDRMIGFSSDLYDPKKLKSIGKKITDNTTLPLNEALEKAKGIYEDNRNSF